MDEKSRSAKRQVWIGTLWVLALCMGGCHGGLRVPADWVQQSVARLDEVQHASALNGEHGRMQVILCFGLVLDNHSVLRLECPGREPLFWDPGGIYGEGDERVGRRLDVLRHGAPTAEQWWEFRRDGFAEYFHLVYEWELSRASAEAKYAALTPDSVPSGTFNPDAGGGACCRALCRFLQLHAADEMTVPRIWTFPHKLGEHLWTQRPDRVIVFDREHGRRVFGLEDAKPQTARRRFSSAAAR